MNIRAMTYISKIETLIKVRYEIAENYFKYKYNFYLRIKNMLN